MTVLQSLLLGVVEGLTEFLPVSSTGHLILASSLLGLAQTDFQKTFEIAIQLGAILAVVVLYWRSFLDTEILKRVAVAFIPTGVIGFLLYTFVKAYLIGNEQVVLWALLLGGIALILFEWWHQEHPEAVGEVREISYTQATLIGLCQSVAVIPGVSRSGASILGGLFFGLKRTAIVEFSFLLAVPTMLAATGYDLLKNASIFSGAEFGSLSIGFVASFIVALAAIRFLIRFVQTRTFVPFGIYRIAVAAIFLLFVI